jgi:hypothetical protein
MTICWALCLQLRLFSTRCFSFSLHSGVNLVKATFSEESSCLPSRSTLDSGSARFAYVDNCSLVSCYVCLSLTGSSSAGLLPVRVIRWTTFLCAASSVLFDSSDAPPGMASPCGLNWLGHSSTETSSRRFLIGLSCSNFDPPLFSTGPILRRLLYCLGTGKSHIFVSVTYTGLQVLRRSGS